MPFAQSSRSEFRVGRYQAVITLHNCSRQQVRGPCAGGSFLTPTQHISELVNNILQAKNIAILFIVYCNIIVLKRYCNSKTENALQIHGGQNSTSTTYYQLLRMHLKFKIFLVLIFIYIIFIYYHLLMINDILVT